MGTVARIAATAIAVAAAIPSGGTSLLAVGLGGISATAAAGIAIAANLGASLLATPPVAGGGGSQTEWSANPRASQPIVFGRTGTGGNIVYRKGSGSGDNNQYQTLVTVLSGAGPVDAIEASLADKTALAFNNMAALAPFAGWLWEDRQLGACPEPAALNTGVGNKPGWTAAHRLSGLAAVMTSLRFDNRGDGTFLTEPQMLWVLRGVRAYDPRFDSTYPGGSGPQRANDQTTWVWTRNPYVIGLTWAIGWRQNGILIAGAGQPLDSIDVASFVEGANIADLNAWPCGGQVTTGDDKWEVLKSILQAGGGEPLREGARLSCIVNAPRLPIATITTDDLGGEVRAPTTLPRKSRINGVTPTYRSEPHFWEQVPGTLVTDPNFVAADGGERTREITYPLVQVEGHGTAADQPTQLAGYDLENSREAGPITMQLKLRWLGYRAGDCLACGIEDSGLAGKQLLVTRRALDPSTGAVTLTLRTEDPTKHARIFGRTGDLPPVVEPDRPDAPGQYQLPPAQTRAAYLIVRQTVAYPVGSTPNTITIAAFNATIDDGRTFDFPAQEITGLTPASVYLVLWDLVASTFVAVPAPGLTESASSRYVIVRETTTANADGTYPAYPTPPGGDGGGGYGGGGCPILTARILLANADRTGPGETIAAGDIGAGAWVWSQHETTGVWGAYLVTAARSFESDLCAVGSRPLTSPSHLWWTDGGWSRADMLGKPAGRGHVVAMTVADAHTYVVVDDEGQWLLSHNKQAQADG